MIEDFFVAIGEIALNGFCIILLLYCLHLFVIWQFLKSAVKSGVKEALAETPSRTKLDSRDCFNISQAVRLGVVEANQEIEEQKRKNNILHFDGSKKD